MGLIHKLFQFFAKVRVHSHPTVPLLWDQDTVLVGSLRNREQLDICLGCNFYHIPANMLTAEDLPISHVAIYQSRRFYGKKATIRYYGKVTDTKLLPRNEITEIPREDDTLYYRFEIDNWRTLPRSIQATEMPASHLLTNQYLLLRSPTTSHLTMQSQDAYRQFCELITLAKRRRSCTIAMNEIEITFKRGSLTYTNTNGQTITISRADFLARPAMYFHQMTSQGLEI